MPVAAYVFKKTVSANLNSLLWAAFPLQSFIRPIKVDIIFSKYFSGFKKTCHRCRNKGRSHTHPKPQLRQLIHCEKCKSTGSIFHARQMLPQSSSPFFFFFQCAFVCWNQGDFSRCPNDGTEPECSNCEGRDLTYFKGFVTCLFLEGKTGCLQDSLLQKQTHPEAVSLAIQQAPSSPSPNTNYICCRKESGGICS